MSIHFDIRADVAVVFLSYFKRAPEFEAMQHYAGLLEGFLANPQTADQAFTLLAAQVYADGVGAQEIPAGASVSNTDYVTWLYDNALGRAPDPAGLQYWVEALDTGQIDRAALVGVWLDAALGSGGRDTQYLANRTEVAVAFADWTNSNPQILPGLKYNAAEVLLGVNENPATVAEGLSRLETGSAPSGEMFFLTPEIDTWVGTSSNDVFNAVFVDTGDAIQGTLTPFDSLDGGLGHDVLNIYVMDAEINGTMPAHAVIRNIEVVNIYNGGASNSEVGVAESLLNVAHYEGVEEFWQIQTASDVVGVGADVVIGFRDLEEMQNLIVGLTPDVSLAQVVLQNVANQHLDLTLEDILIAGQALDTLVLRGSLQEGSATPWVGIGVGHGVRTVQVDSDLRADLYFYLSQLDLDPTLIHTIDASVSSGDLDFWVDWSDVVVEGLTLTMGSGNDSVFFEEGRTLSLQDTIKGGSGHDLLALGVSGVVQTQTYDAIARTRDFEVIGFFNEGEGEALVTVDAAQLQGFESLRLLWGPDYSTNPGDSYRVQNLGADMVLEVEGAHLNDVRIVSLQHADADVTLDLNGSALYLEVDEEAIGATGGTLTVRGGPGVEAQPFSLTPSWLDSSDDLDGVDDVDDAEADWEPAQVSLGYYNSHGKFSTFDATEFEGLFFLSGMSGAVAETVYLGEDTVGWLEFRLGEKNSSTVANTDVIHGFLQNTELEQPNMIHLSDVMAIETADFSNQVSLEDALAAAAALYAGEQGLSADTLLIFLYDTDAYFFGDTVLPQQGLYDEGDFLVQFTGVNDLQALANTVLLLSVDDDADLL